MHRGVSLFTYLAVGIVLVAVVAIVFNLNGSDMLSITVDKAKSLAEWWTDLWMPVIETFENTLTP